MECQARSKDPLEPMEGEPVVSSKRPKLLYSRNHPLFEILIYSRNKKRFLISIFARLEISRILYSLVFIFYQNII